MPSAQNCRGGWVEKIVGAQCNRHPLQSSSAVLPHVKNGLAPQQVLHWIIKCTRGTEVYHLLVRSTAEKKNIYVLH